MNEYPRNISRDGFRYTDHTATLEGKTPVSLILGIYNIYVIDSCYRPHKYIWSRRNQVAPGIVRDQNSIQLNSGIGSRGTNVSGLSGIFIFHAVLIYDIIINIINIII